MGRVSIALSGGRGVLLGRYLGLRLSALIFVCFVCWNFYLTLQRIESCMTFMALGHCLMKTFLIIRINIVPIALPYHISQIPS